LPKKVKLSRNKSDHETLGAPVSEWKGEIESGKLRNLLCSDHNGIGGKRDLTLFQKEWQGKRQVGFIKEDEEEGKR